ncbi:50S ribosomal protein L7/L12 [Candidatus Curtissbacteria bacterium RIFCSPLOWO2_02_41_11]|uniref:Large ribosomal subunit protein bL12 n=1 Tax=Candidatus Curtissbacteria bacterium RIFCSPLOWO2_02_41_11 TaxID=1797731 RepID=A0A1F5HU46_9BACT|nr:MAG: 50S ribosomal protein L7/L12 [Candidatus Curtissbacteria bacterium RIFCSPLOWO2_02_41_11]
MIKDIEELSVLELSELVKALEEKFGVTAAVPMAAATAGSAPAAGGEEAASEQTTFNVILTDSGANKISVIKAVREIVPTLGLKETKDLVDAPPKEILTGVNKENAQEAKTKLETAGAKVELK